MAKKARKYWTVAEWLPALERWTPQFGDYDKKVAQEEMRDMSAGGIKIKAKHLALVSSEATQAAINAVCATIPAPV